MPSYFSVQTANDPWSGLDCPDCGLPISEAHKDLEMTSLWKLAPVAIALLLPSGISVDPSEAAAGRSEFDPQREIVWHDGRPSEPVFVPGILFEEHELSELPLTPGQREDVERWVEQHRNPQRYFPPSIVERGIPCMENLSGATQGHAENAVPLPDLVQQAPVALVGQVTDVVHGKDDMLLGIGRLVYIEVKEILRVNGAEKSSAPEVGDLIAVLKEGGQINVSGVTVCERTPPEFQQPEIGDWLLVLGESSATVAPVIGNSKTFPIEGDQVMPQPYHSLRVDESPRQLRSIRSVPQGGTS